MGGISLQSNTASLQAQRQLGNSSDRLSSVFERLSSGQRINSASDDAASLAVADTLGNRSRLYSQAVRNLNDAISAIQIIDSTLESQTGILVRLAELAQQSANGTLSDQQRATIQTEYSELIEEYGRLGDAAQFNDFSLLRGTRDGNSEELSFQVGIDGSEDSRISQSIADSGTTSGQITLVDVNNDSNFSGLDQAVLINSGNDEITYDELVSFFNNKHGTQTVTSSTGEEVEIAYALYSITGAQNSLAVYALDPSTGEYERLSVGDNQFLINQSNGEITTPEDALINDTFSTSFAGDIDVSFDFRGMTFYDPRSQQGNDTVLEFSGVETTDRALLATDLINQKLSDVNSLRGEIGAQQSRLESAAAVAAASRENSLSAESRIRDIDVAEEAAKLAASQIQQQVATAVLASANQTPALALTLLGQG